MRSWEMSACRLKAREGGGDLPQRGVGDLLANHPGLGRDADEDAAALTIEERGKGFASARQLGGGFLEFYRLGFAGGDDLFQILQRHGW